MSRRDLWVVAACVLSLIAVGCAGDSVSDAPSETAADSASETDRADATTTADAAATDIPEPTPSEPAQETDESTEVVEESPEPELVPPSFAATVRPSLEQLHVLDAPPGQELVLRSGGDVIAMGQTDDFGSLLWRDIPAGNYTVGTLDGAESIEHAVWLTDDRPNPSFYTDQVIDEGFGYLTTRDGTTLSVNVILPAGDGPFPTVVEYSGYTPSNPADATIALLYNTLGYAYVGVNMRGTGCSGGSFQFFEPIQRFDGYDAIEAIAAQPWVQHNAVGMVGISYPGISQLFVAETQPPSLSAITPLSVIDDTFRSTLYPGGVLNTGFAVQWSNDRQAAAEPLGQGWEQARIDEGDTICEANQRLRLQNPDALALIRDNEFYDPEVADELAPITFVDRIEVPVFMAGAWQDEQTGGHFPELIEAFTGSPAVFATMVNGTHTEALSSPILTRYVDFLSLYVKREVPGSGAALAAPILSSTLTGIAVPADLDDRYDGLDYDAARAVFESDPLVRILFEQGAADGFEPGAAAARFEASFDQWPPPGEVTRWYLGADGSLAPTASDDATVTSFTTDPAALPPTIYEGGSGGIWQADVDYNWQPIPDGTGAGWTSAALDADAVVIGPGSVDLWVQTSATDVDLEVTLSEVRPDGTEVYVQAGWLRASHRALDDDRSTELRPAHTHLAADAADMPDGDYAPLRIEIFPVAHVFRAGSQIRLTIDAPGGSRPLWAFDETFPGGTEVSIAHDAERPASLVLNVVDGVEVPAGHPECGSLRGQPCRVGSGG